MKYALFGVDGIILDSTTFDYNLGEMYLLNKGITPKEDLSLRLYHLSIYDRAAYLKFNYKLPEETDDIYDALFQAEADYYINEVLLRDGIVDVLDILKRNDYKIYVISDILPEWAKPCFIRLGIMDYFDGMFLEDDLHINKTNEAFYREVTMRLATLAKNCWVFDKKFIHARRASKVGMNVVGIFEAIENESLLESESDIYLNSWKDFDEDSFINFKKEK
ncbi:MAG: HAD family hydrolase [Erysipelotrichaceae bacterium]|nr:HAD family hydrolase [Erysipelotrichaceae bacterium]